MLTFIDIEEILGIEAFMQTSDYVANYAQKKLAEAVTLFVHGEEGLQAALKVTEGMMPGGTEVQLSGAMLKDLASDMPHVKVVRADVVGQKFVDLALKIGLVPSKAEGVRLIKNGGAYLNNERVSEPSCVIGEDRLIDGIYLLLSAGKKKRILVEIEN